MSTTKNKAGTGAPTESAPLEERLAASLGTALKSALAPITERLDRLEQENATTRATDNAAGLAHAGNGPMTFRVGDDASVGKGINFVRAIKAQYVAKVRGIGVVQAAKAMGYETVAKALNQTTATAGAELVVPEFAAEVIELLRANTVVRKLGARVVPMDAATLHINKQTGAATANYIGESGPIAASQQTTGRVTLNEKKLVALTPVTNDLLRNSSVAADQFVRDDLVATLATREDLAFIRGDGTANQPSGIKTLMLAGNVVPATAGVAPTVAVVKAQLAKMVGKLRAANIPMITCGFIITPRVEQYLLGLTDGNGNSVFNELLQGRLWGYPCAVTTQIPENLGAGTNETEIYFGDFAQALIGESMSLEVEVFPNGAYLAGTVQSGISNDESVVRAITKHDFQLRHTASFALGSAVQWGA